MNEHFVLMFTRSGEPRLECFEYDSHTGTYKAKPIARESERAERALASPAGRWHKVIRAFSVGGVRRGGAGAAVVVALAFMLAGCGGGNAHDKAMKAIREYSGKSWQVDACNDNGDVLDGSTVWVCDVYFRGSETSMAFTVDTSSWLPVTQVCQNDIGEWTAKGCF